MPLLTVLTVAERLALAQAAVFGSAEVAAGGGHDTNFFLQVLPEAALREPRIEGWFARVAPTVSAAAAAAGWRLESSYALDWRRGPTVGNLLHQEIELSVATPRLGPASPWIAVRAGLFEADRFAGDGFAFGSGEAGLRLEVTSALRATAAYRAELRRYAQHDDGDLDFLHTGDLRLAYRPRPRFELGVGGSTIGVVTAAGGDVWFGRVGPDIELLWKRLTLAGGLWTGVLQTPASHPRWQMGGAVGVVVRVLPNMDLAAAADLTFTPVPDDVARSYERTYVGLAVVGHMTGKKAFRPAAQPERLRPVVDSGGVRFRMRAPGGSLVEVIGSWDGWASGAGALRRTAESDLWELWIPLPPGSYRYRFVVDGRTVRPPEAARYLADDFGGEDGVVDVP